MVIIQILGVDAESRRSSTIIKGSNWKYLTDGEGTDMDQVGATEVVEEDRTGGIVEGKGETAAEKKTGLRKPLFSVTGGHNSKFAQVLMSPRKRVQAKQSLHRGGGAKQVEEKGTSHPKQLPKP